MAKRLMLLGMLAMLVCGTLTGGSQAGGAAALTAGTTTAAAARPADTRVAVNNVADGAPDGYILLLPRAPGETGPAAAGLLGSRVLEELLRMQARGAIGGFEMVPGTDALRVRGVSAASPATVAALRDLGALVADDAAGQAQVDEAQEAARAQGDMAAVAATTLPAAPAGISSLNAAPTIAVMVQPDYGLVQGITTPDMEVSLTIRRAGGSLRVRAETTSAADGSYLFAPDYSRCRGYGWKPMAGDVVTVTAGGATAQTTVAPLWAWADSDADTVTGTTAPGRAVSVVSTASEMRCDPQVTHVDTASDGEGAFGVALAGDMDRSGSATVWVENGDGGYTGTLVRPPHIEISADDSIRAVVAPGAGVLLENYIDEDLDWSATTRADAYGRIVFPKDQPGRPVRLRVSGGGVTLETQRISFDDWVLNPATDWVTATIPNADPGYTVRMSMARNPNIYCASEAGCAVAVTDDDGLFLLDYGAEGYDLKRGDISESLDIYDSEGNVQAVLDRPAVPIIMLNSYTDIVQGYVPPQIQLGPAVRVNTAGGDVRTFIKPETDFYSGYYYGKIYDGVYYGETLELRLSPGGAMFLPNTATVTARLNPDLTVTGSAPRGEPLRITYWREQFDAASGSYWAGSGHCLTPASSTYNVSFAEMNRVMATDEVEVSYINPDGHCLQGYSHAVLASAEMGEAWAWGMAPSPSMGVTVQLWRGTSRLISSYATADTDGYYEVPLTTSTRTYAVQAGDRIRVQPSGWAAYDLNIPTLTMIQDPGGNRVVGTAPANSAVTVRVTDPRQMWEQRVTVDSGGAYVAPFSGYYNEWACRGVQVGDCTAIATIYADGAGHRVYAAGPEPEPVAADAYESDDVARGSEWTGIQHHTFHKMSDSDWVHFTVGPDDIGATYYVCTTNLGANGDTKMCLYGPNSNISLVGCSNDYNASQASRIIWVPHQAGVYGLQVGPADIDSFTTCGSSYDLNIFKISSHTFLPQVAQYD